MNIIFLTPEIPFPPNSGARINTWERLKQLKRKGNNIYLFSLREKYEQVIYDEYNIVCESFKTYERERLPNLFRSILGSYTIGTRYNTRMYHDIKELMESRKIDMVIIDALQMILNCPFDNDISKVITVHNIEHESFKSIAQRSTNIIKKILFYLESFKLKSYEKKLIKKNLITGYTFVSQKEMDWFSHNYEGQYKYTCIPQGYSLCNIKKAYKDTKMIVFTGKMDYEPNIQATVWFANDILPKIENQINGCIFYIVGKNPANEVKQLAGRYKNIIVTGQVDDVLPYLEEAAIYVIPLKSGGGVKIKLFEAIGNGNIVVSTSKGIEGTEFKGGEHLIIADEASEFADKCVEVLKNTSKYMQLPVNGMNLINKKYAWNSIGDRYNEFLNSLLA